MQTRSGIPVDEFSPDAPDLRSAVAAVIDAGDGYMHERALLGWDDRPNSVVIPYQTLESLRSAYEATPESRLQMMGGGSFYATDEDVASMLAEASSLQDADEATPEPAPSLTDGSILLDQSTTEAVIRIVEAAQSAGIDGWFGVYEQDIDAVLARLAGRA